MRERRWRTSANETALLPELTGFDSGNGPQQSSSNCATRTLTAMVQSAIGNELAGENQGLLLTPRYTIWRAARLPRGSHRRTACAPAGVTNTACWHKQRCGAYQLPCPVAESMLVRVLCDAMFISRILATQTQETLPRCLLLLDAW